MPRKYVRKPDSNRAQWSEESLKEALRRIQAGDIKISHAARYYKIPRRTLQRKLHSGKHVKGPLGPPSIFGTEHEKLLVRHVQRLQRAGFAVNRVLVRCMAFHFAEMLGIKHPFDKERQIAGYNWLTSFIERNQEIATILKCQSEGSQTMDVEEVKDFFDVLKELYIDHGLISAEQCANHKCLEETDDDESAEVIVAEKRDKHGSVK